MKKDLETKLEIRPVPQLYVWSVESQVSIVYRKQTGNWKCRMPKKGAIRMSFVICQRFDWTVGSTFNNRHLKSQFTGAGKGESAKSVRCGSWVVGLGAGVGSERDTERRLKNAEYRRNEKSSCISPSTFHLEHDWLEIRFATHNSKLFRTFLFKSESNRE